jgi:osmotically inducible protein OsmC
MAKRKATATWNGGITNGTGTMALGSGAFEGSFSVNTRMGDEPGTNPEELVGAALAGCFSMALSGALEKAGYAPNKIETKAVVDFGKDDKGFAITGIALTTDVDADGLSDDEFQKIAADTKTSCPVSKALKAVPIELSASLAKA